MIPEYLVSLIFAIFIFNLFLSQSLKFRFLVDNDFKKKQSFHFTMKSNIGGFCIILILLSFNFFISNIFTPIIFFSLCFFIVGFLDDLKIVTSPFIRFICLIVIITFMVINQKFYVHNFGLYFLQEYLDINILIILTIVSLFLVINGANLIDGFNGLLSIHILIILITLAFLFELNFPIILVCILLLTFLYFNLIKQNIFLGDSGAYFLGSLTSILIIQTANETINVSPFFFGILLFYLYFETFFSVIRKLLMKKNPFKPDKNHLHMLLYLYLKKSKLNSPNNLTGILINISFFVLILPTIFFINNDLFCIVYFIIMHFVYLISYKMLYEKK